MLHLVALKIYSMFRYGKREVMMTDEVVDTVTGQGTGCACACAVYDGSNLLSFAWGESDFSAPRLGNFYQSV